MQIRKYFALPLLLVALTLTACATTGGSRSSGSPNVITQQEIRASGYTNAYDVVRSLKPMWLQRSGQMSINSSSYIAVYKDGMRLGSTGALYEINARNIAKIEYFNAIRASSRFGLNNLQGAIVVTTL